jgi:chaperonin cofactor prefoldin
MSDLNKKFIDLNKKLDRVKNEFERIDESQNKIKKQLPGLLKRLQKRNSFGTGGKVKRINNGSRQKRKSK